MANETISTLETKLQIRYADLDILKEEFKAATSQGQRQLIHEDIVALLDVIDRLQEKIDKGQSS